MPPLTDKSAIADLCARRHAEHCEFELRWQWEQDTLEGGDRYRRARYGVDARGLDLQNMVRNKRDYVRSLEPREGADPASNASDSDYELKLAKTAPPSFLEDAIGIHLSKVYKTDPERSGPALVETWWKDVDAKRTSIGEWMQEVAPTYCANAQLDIICDHPAPPEGVDVQSYADEIRLGLTGCVIKTILPQNMLWWRLDALDRYVECLVREPQEDGSTRYRHWTPTDWTLYEQKCDEEAVEQIGTGSHPYKRPPIERVLYKKRSRCRNVGRNRYEAICERTRAYYNLDGDLKLTETLQATPTLQAPADLLSSGTIQVGPSGVLPMLETQGSDGQVTFTGFSYLDPPKGAADSLRTSMQIERDEIDRIACLTKPAGAQGTTGSTVSQSGLSKEMDEQTGNALLSELAAALARLEWTASALALMVLTNGAAKKADYESIQVSYPKTFELSSTATIAKTIEDYQGFMGSVGATPKVEAELVKRFIRVSLPGRDPDLYSELDDEVTGYIESKADTFEQDAEAARAAAQAETNQQPAGANGGDGGDAADLFGAPADE